MSIMHLIAQRFCCPRCETASTSGRDAVSCRNLRVTTQKNLGRHYRPNTPQQQLQGRPSHKAQLRRLVTVSASTTPDAADSSDAATGPTQRPLTAEQRAEMRANLEQATKLVNDMMEEVRIGSRPDCNTTMHARRTLFSTLQTMVQSDSVIWAGA